MTAIPVTNPMIADRATTTSVLISTDCENSDHVWQLAIQKGEPSGRKKSFRQSKTTGRLEFLGAVPRSPEEAASSMQNIP